jgi:5,5'-dehydrodivanillate O-demethylase
LKITSYPVQELGGLVFAYLGPEPVPLLPRWDLLVREDLERTIRIAELECNWLQPMDNAMDPVHFEHLHAGLGNYVMKKLGKPAMMNPARHVKIDFDVFEYGIFKRRLLEGEPEDCDDWTTGHPVLFPNILAQGGDTPSFQIRVPIDDTHTVVYWYTTRVRKADNPVQATVPVGVQRHRNPDGSYVADTIPGQDMLAWAAQGPVSDRTTEHLVSSDKGIQLYRKVLNEQLERIARGEDPMGVVRDPEINDPMIVIPRERRRLEAFHIDNESDRDSAFADDPRFAALQR